MDKSKNQKSFFDQLRPEFTYEQDNVSLTEPNQAYTVRQILQQYQQGFVHNHVNTPSDLYNTENYSEDELLDMDLTYPEDITDVIQYCPKDIRTETVEPKLEPQPEPQPEPQS